MDTRLARDPSSARVTADELRTILLTDPDGFDMECEKIIRASTDPVTKRFWRDVQEFARADRDE